MHLKRSVEMKLSSAGQKCYVPVRLKIRGKQLSFLFHIPHRHSQWDMYAPLERPLHPLRMFFSFSSGPYSGHYPFSRNFTHMPINLTLLPATIMFPLDYSNLFLPTPSIFHPGLSKILLSYFKPFRSFPYLSRF